jgi:signal transduction histidine kinase
MLVRGISKQTHTNLPLKNRLLMIFRALALIRLLVSVVLIGLQGHSSHSLAWIQVITVIEVLLLLGYLFMPVLQTYLGNVYLLVAIIWTTVVPLLVQNIRLYWEFDTFTGSISAQSMSVSVSNAMLLGSINQTILVLLVPLIVVAWAYSRSGLILYCIGSAFFDFVISFLLLHHTSPIFLLVIPIIVFRTLLYAVIGIIINQLVSIQIDQEHKLFESYRRLQEYALIQEQLATSQERNRIARELHDTLAHTLTAATVQLEAVSIIWDNQPQKAQAMVKKSASMMREGLAETRRALHALRAGTLDKSNLTHAIGDLAESLMGRFPVLIQVNAVHSIGLPDASVEHGLYRIVQEALFNAARHAQATQISIDIETLGVYVLISIRDNGVGFQLHDVVAAGHFGLQGMKERAQQIGAELDIRSQVGYGTTVTVKWNIKGGIYEASNLR